MLSTLFTTNALFQTKLENALACIKHHHHHQLPHALNQTLTKPQIYISTAKPDEWPAYKVTSLKLNIAIP
jgi:hypothetical protein